MKNKRSSSELTLLLFLPTRENGQTSVFSLGFLLLSVPYHCIRFVGRHLFILFVFGSPTGSWPGRSPPPSKMWPIFTLVHGIHTLCRCFCGECRLIVYAVLYLLCLPASYTFMVWAGLSRGPVWTPLRACFWTQGHLERTYRSTEYTEKPGIEALFCVNKSPVTKECFHSLLERVSRLFEPMPAFKWLQKLTKYSPFVWSWLISHTTIDFSQWRTDSVNQSWWVKSLVTNGSQVQTQELQISPNRNNRIFQTRKSRCTILCGLPLARTENTALNWLCVGVRVIIVMF